MKLPRCSLRLAVAAFPIAIATFLSHIWFFMVWDTSQLPCSSLGSREEHVHPPYGATGAARRDVAVQIPHC